MQKMTLLSMVQNILSAMDSDEVNSITDTIESLQVAEVVRETYWEQFNDIIIPEFNGLIKLDGLSDLASPNYLKIPDNVTTIDWVRYTDERNSGKFREIEYLKPEDFLDRFLQYSSAGPNLALTQDPVSGIQYYVKNNSCPTFYTLFDDFHIAFDSFDNLYDATLHQSKSMAFGTTIRTFPLEDDFIPFLDANLFPLLLAEAKATSFINFKQISSAKEEQRARRQRIRMQNDQYRSKIQQGSRKSWDFSRRRR